MSYLVLARKFRPQTFEDVIAQGHVTQTLANAISSGRVAHAILFAGPRGHRQDHGCPYFGKSHELPAGAEFDALQYLPIL